MAAPDAAKHVWKNPALKRHFRLKSDLSPASGMCFSSLGMTSRPASTHPDPSPPHHFPPTGGAQASHTSTLPGAGSGKPGPLIAPFPILHPPPNAPHFCHTWQMLPPAQPLTGWGDRKQPAEGAALGCPPTRGAEAPRRGCPGRILLS